MHRFGVVVVFVGWSSVSACGDDSEAFFDSDASADGNASTGGNNTGGRASGSGGRATGSGGSRAGGSGGAAGSAGQPEAGQPEQDAALGGSGGTAAGDDGGVRDATPSSGGEASEGDGSPNGTADAADPTTDASDATRGACVELEACCQNIENPAFRRGCSTQASSGVEETCELVRELFCDPAVATPDAGSTDAGSACADLEACCPALPMGQRRRCESVVDLGAPETCSVLLLSLQLTASCG